MKGVENSKKTFKTQMLIFLVQIIYQLGCSKY